MQGDAGSYTTKILPAKVCFQAEFGNLQNILSLKILGYMVVIFATPTMIHLEYVQSTFMQVLHS